MYVLIITQTGMKISVGGKEEIFSQAFTGIPMGKLFCGGIRP